MYIDICFRPGNPVLGMKSDQVIVSLVGFHICMYYSYNCFMQFSPFNHTIIPHLYIFTSIFIVSPHSLGLMLFVCSWCHKKQSLSYLILSYLILSYLILSYLILSYLILSYYNRNCLCGGLPSQVYCRWFVRNNLGGIEYRFTELMVGSRFSYNGPPQSCCDVYPH